MKGRLRSVEIRAGRLLVDGVPRFLLSGEVHYFRIARRDWPNRLATMKRAGFDAVSTYVPWRWHEIRPGRTDFAGRTHPERDLRGFVDAAARAGLDVTLRVGPVSNGEMALEGLPDRLLKIPHCIQTVSSPMHHVNIPAYGEGAYRRECLAWLDEVLPEVVRTQAPAGGPVILLQLCNEIGMIPWVTQIPPDGPDSLRSFQTHCRDLGLKDPAGFPPPRRGARAPKPIDFVRADWVRETYAAYYALLADRARAHGVAVPLIANIPQFWDVDVRGRGWFAPETSTFFRRIRDRTPRTIFGGAYQPRRIDAENCHDIPIASEAVRSVQAPGDVSMCAELQTGALMDRPRLYPADIALNLRVSAATDLRVLNTYMQAGGRNLPGIGQIGPEHDWQAPIGPAGEARPHLAATADFGAAKRVLADALAEADLVTAVDLLVPRAYYEREFMRDAASDEVRAARDAWLFDGIARLLYLANVPPRWRWIGGADAPLDARRGAVVFTLRSMPRVAQEEVADLVRRGGRIVIGPEIPVEDECGRPCRLLAGALGIRPGRRSRPAAGVAWMWGRPLPIVRHPYEVVAGRGRVEARAGSDVVARSGRCGRGRWLAIGLGLSDRYDRYREIADGIARFLGAVRPAEVVRQTAGQGLMLLLRRGPAGAVLFVGNYHDLEADAVLRCEGARLRVRLGRREAALLPLGARASGVEIVSAESEIRRLERRDGRLIIETAAAGARVVVRTVVRAGGKAGGRARAVVTGAGADSGAGGTAEIRISGKA